MKHQFTITIDTPDSTLAGRIRDEAVGAIEDMIESCRTRVGVGFGSLIDVGSINDMAAIEAARQEHEDEGTLEIDETPIVSFSSDGGAYVGAWVWVSDAQIAAQGGTNPETQQEEEVEK